MGFTADETAARAAALWRRIRWAAAVFCVVQFAAYTPSPGVRVPFALLPAGLALGVLIGLVNVAAGVVERRVPRSTHGGGAPALRDLVLLVADTALVALVVWLFSFDAYSAVWVLLVVPLLQAGLLGRLRLALWTWAGTVVVLAISAALGTVLYDVVSSFAALVSSVGYRSGMLLLVALVVGSQASTTHEYVQLLHTARAQLLHEATHDPLTGLANRALFVDRARQALSAHDPDDVVAVVYVDCDRFKQVNDTYGHAAGDVVLVEVARRIEATVRSVDTVGRLGGDEFAALLAGVREHEVRRIAERVRRSLAEPYQGFDTGTIDMTCSVGVAIDDGEVDRLPDLLRRADAAMYRHKPGARLRAV